MITCVFQKKINLLYIHTNTLLLLSKHLTMTFSKQNQILRFLILPNLKSKVFFFTIYYN